MIAERSARRAGGVRPGSGSRPEVQQVAPGVDDPGRRAARPVEGLGGGLPSSPEGSP
jgi:hypothetical protein